MDFDNFHARHCPSDAHLVWALNPSVSLVGSQLKLGCILSSWVKSPEIAPALQASHLPSGLAYLRLTVLCVIEPALVLQDTSGFVGNIPATIELNMAPNAAFVLGRGTPHWKADVTINATRDGKDIISRKHAKIDRQANKFVITDLVKSLHEFVTLTEHNFVRRIRSMAHMSILFGFRGMC